MKALKQKNRQFSLEKLPAFSSVSSVIKKLKPVEPIYCLYPHIIKHTTNEFKQSFHGKVLFAVKTNPDPYVIDILSHSGINDFDVASLSEIELVKKINPNANCYFMAPVRFPGASKTAYAKFGVENFVVDHKNELARVLDQTKPGKRTIFIRISPVIGKVAFDHSGKFGASFEQAEELADRICLEDGKFGLAFNTGSLILDPGPYVKTIENCVSFFKKYQNQIIALDIGGGFPVSYAGLNTPSLKEIFKSIYKALEKLPNFGNFEILTEPGRALVANGVSVLTQVLLKKNEKIYLNDGIYGSFQETVASKGLAKFPTRVFINKGQLSQDTADFNVFGPTCDGLDVLPQKYNLPINIQEGDWIEFGMVGAYGAALRTRFNGFHPDKMIRINNPEEMPPTVELSQNKGKETLLSPSFLSFRGGI